jgi:hypothetical protein
MSWYFPAVFLINPATTPFAARRLVSRSIGAIGILGNCHKLAGVVRIVSPDESVAFFRTQIHPLQSMHKPLKMKAKWMTLMFSLPPRFRREKPIGHPPARKVTANSVGGSPALMRQQ